MPHPFSERYNKLTNSELLEILNNPTGYQPLAVEAANSEFKCRQLTEEQIADAKAYNETLRQEKLKQKEKVAAFQEKAKNIGTKILDDINPTNHRTDERLIKIICAVLGGLFLYNVISDFEMLKLMLQDVGSFDSSSFFYFLPFIMIPIATILFWLKKKLGWALLSIHLTFVVFTLLYSIISDLNRQPSTIPALDNLFPHTSPLIYIAQIIFYGGILTVISKQSIREIYSVSRNFLFITIGIIAALTTFQWWEILLN